MPHALAALMLFAASAQLIDDDRIIFRRGDANDDGSVGQADVTCIANWLFLGGPEPGCLNAADANDDGSVDNADVVSILSWLYSGGPAPASPGPYASACSEDSEPYPGCSVPPSACD